MILLMKSRSSSISTFWELATSCDSCVVIEHQGSASQPSLEHGWVPPSECQTQGFKYQAEGLITDPTLLIQGAAGSWLIFHHPLDSLFKTAAEYMKATLF